MMNDLGLYVHIPFCERRCNYCDFYSNIFSTEESEKFTEATVQKIKAFSEVYKYYNVDTIYFGGGTPSVLPLSQLEKIVNAIYKNFKCHLKEFTIEVNPNSAKFLKEYSELGINRLSVGVQSLNDDLLKKLGRLHNRTEAIQTLETANKYFNNISSDMMIGLETQTETDIVETIDILSKYSTHISQYMLKVEEGTRLFKQVTKGETILPNEDAVCDFYLKCVEELGNMGFIQYEISNFCKDNKIAIHNTKYWQREPYLGIGKGAHSQIGDERFEDMFENRVILSETDKFNEEIMLGLRLTQGIDINKINNKYCLDFSKKYEKQLLKLKDLLVYKDGFLSIKPQHLLIQNSIVVEFLV